MTNRLLTDADLASAAALLEATMSWPAGEGTQMLQQMSADPNVTIAVNSAVQTLCRLHYFDAPAQPWGSGLSTQIAELLPLTVGLFTDGTMPSLLAYGLQQHILRVPASASRPVWAWLEDLTTVGKYQLVFRNPGLPAARQVKVSGHYISMLRCSDARGTVAALV